MKKHKNILGGLWNKMGISQRNIIILGCKLEYKDSYYDKLEDLELGFNKEDVGKIKLVSDGMGGEYILIGDIIYFSEDGRFEETDIPLTILDSITKERKNKIKDLIKSKLNIDVKVSYIILTYYS